jgi:hypothetical protein
MTFPVTPESLPFSSASLHNDTNIVGIGERDHFVGRTLESVSFSGQLEPPAVYRGGRRRQRRGGADVRGSKRGEGFNPRALPLQEARSRSTRSGILMEEGAVGGKFYYEPWDFILLLARAQATGEKVRLIASRINMICTIRDFNWRYEDPDPDVYYYDLTFKRHLPITPPKAPKKKEDPAAATHYTTRRGDSLGKIAVLLWNDRQKWTGLRDLNRQALAKLWFYPALPQPTAGAREPARGDGWQLGSAQWNPDMVLRGGVKLAVRKARANQNAGGPSVTPDKPKANQGTKPDGIRRDGDRKDLRGLGERIRREVRRDVEQKLRKSGLKSPWDD